MKKNRIVLLATPLLIWQVVLGCSSSSQKTYICPPCDLPCDTILFHNKGNCPHCQMKLVEINPREMNLIPGEIEIRAGKGAFLMEGGQGKLEKYFKIFYYCPENLSENSRILMVVPGAGRSAISYREDWIKTADQQNILVLSFEYQKKDYPFEAYHGGGVLEEQKLAQKVEAIAGSNQVFLDEAQIDFKVNPKKETWLFPDFDRVFEKVKKEIQSNQEGYDIFGHSAGGQILHRFALLYPESRARKILAANAGFFTLPDTSQIFPFGLKGIPAAAIHLRESFGKELVVLVGDQDNAQEKGGTLLRSARADLQGQHRLARARYFFETSRQLGSKMRFNWKYLEVPGVGHDHTKMAKAAAEYLYQ